MWSLFAAPPHPAGLCPKESYVPAFTHSEPFAQPFVVPTGSRGRQKASTGDLGQWRLLGRCSPHRSPGRTVVRGRRSASGLASPRCCDRQRERRDCGRATRMHGRRHGLRSGTTGTWPHAGEGRASRCRVRRRRCREPAVLKCVVRRGPFDLRSDVRTGSSEDRSRVGTRLPRRAASSGWPPGRRQDSSVRCSAWSASTFRPPRGSRHPSAGVTRTTSGRSSVMRSAR